MQRLLIADTSNVFAKAIARQLSGSYLIEICDNGQRALELIGSFEPDILLLDLQVPGEDGISILHALHTAGKDIRVIVMSRLLDEFICRQLEQLQVCYVLRKGCALSTVITRIRDVSFRLSNPETEAWYLENETERILLELGVNMGSGRFYYTSCAILLKYADPDGFVTKCIYPEVAKRFGGTATQVEKAIRDGIRAAWKNGNRAIWQLYFPPGGDGRSECPSNEVFIARIAGALRQKARMKMPYIPQKEKAQ